MTYIPLPRLQGHSLLGAKTMIYFRSGNNATFVIIHNINHVKHDKLSFRESRQNLCVRTSECTPSGSPTILTGSRDGVQLTNEKGNDEGRTSFLPVHSNERLEVQLWT